MELIDRLQVQLISQMIPINFYIDLSKAFDSLNHEILLYTFSHYGVNGFSSTLLRSYLSNRKQYVTIGDVKSAVLSITTGVPHGSIIGPLLFNIYTNDIIKSNAKFIFILYADDTPLNSTHKSFGDTLDEIQLSILNEFPKVCKWLNQLCLNVAKSQFMLFHMPQKVIPN